jgi:hypothetical protein
MLLMGLGFVFMRWHMHCHEELLHEHVDRATFRRGTLYTIFLGPVAYLVGAGLAWVNEVLAFLCYAAIVLYFVLPHSMRERR